MDDVKRHVRGSTSRAGSGAGIPPIPAVDFSNWGEIEIQPLTKIKRVSGASLSRSWLNLPHVTQHDEADITELEAFRRARAQDAEARGVKLTLLLFEMKASALAIRHYPEFGASLDPSGENIRVREEPHGRDGQHQEEHEGDRDVVQRLQITRFISLRAAVVHHSPAIMPVSGDDAVA